jgi:hypothetical protein
MYKICTFRYINELSLVGIPIIIYKRESLIKSHQKKNYLKWAFTIFTLNKYIIFD